MKTVPIHSGLDPHRLCALCPRQCRTDRSTPEGLKRSLCRAPRGVKVALVSLHQWEEPCISGKNGAGTVFFSHCNLRCCFCQNYAISTGGKGWTVSVERLAQIFLEQQKRGAECLELVTPGHYTDEILEALALARASGLALRCVWNSNGYELPATLERLAGAVDVFLPDLKYFDSALGARYSGVPHYFERASEAIRTMHRLVGPAKFDAEGRLVRGMIVRHLVLPWQWKDSFKCLEWLHGEFGDSIWISLMNQYMPLYGAAKHPEINRRLTTMEYQKVVRYARELGITNAYMQVGQTQLAKFIPVFDGRWVLSAQ